MLMQNFGVTNKEHYGMLWHFLEWSITHLTNESSAPLCPDNEEFNKAPLKAHVRCNPHFHGNINIANIVIIKASYSPGRYRAEPNKTQLTLYIFLIGEEEVPLFTISSYTLNLLDYYKTEDQASSLELLDDL